MKIKDFLKLFSGIDENLDIKAVCSYVSHSCSSDGYCYCSSEDHIFDVSCLEKETKYNKKSKTQEIVGICIRTQEK